MRGGQVWDLLSFIQTRQAAEIVLEERDVRVKNEQRRGKALPVSCGGKRALRTVFVVDYTGRTVPLVSPWWSYSQEQGRLLSMQYFSAAVSFSTMTVFRFLQPEKTP